MRLVLAAALALGSVLPAAAQEVAEGSVVHYRCGADPLAAAYINAADGASYAVVVWGGKMAVLKAGMSGSGVRYVSIDGSGLVWHTKGDAGFLAHDDAGETMIASDCTAR